MFPKRNILPRPKHLANRAAGKCGNKRYYLKQSLAYTEDHILVSNVFLYNVNPKISPHMLLPYLQTFGKVLEFHLQPMSKGRNAERVIVNEGFVQFDSPHSAVDLLKRIVHHLNGLRFSVKPNYSWNQPDAWAPIDRTGQDTTSLASPIDALNDYCLEHIMCLLSLPDRIHCARSCLRFRGIYKQVSSLLDKSVNLMVFEDMTEWDVRDFFMLSGSYVLHINGTIPKRHCQRFCELTGIYCSNLQTLDIAHTQLNIGNMQKMLVNKDQLQKLALRGCSIENFILPTLRKLQQLKTLDLSGNERLSGSNMDKLPATIESLTLKNCHHLKPNFLPKTCKALPKLKELHINTRSRLKCDFKKLVRDKCCDSVEVLTLKTGWFDQCVYIAELPSLKKLTIKIRQRASEQVDLWASLVEHKSMQLEYLEVHGEDHIITDVLAKICQLKGLRTLALPNNNEIDDSGLELLCALQALEEVNFKNCHQVSNIGVQRLILACPKLRVLHLQGCDVSSTLLTDLIFMLRREIKQKKTQRPLPIKLFGYETEFDEHSLRIPEVAAKDILDVSLTVPCMPADRLIDMMDYFELDTEDYDSLDSDVDMDLSDDLFNEYDNEVDDFMDDLF